LFLLFVVSCASVSNQYRQSNVRVVTNNRVVSGMHFINGWTTEADNRATAQNVGNKVANDLGKKGSHDINILVELKSRGSLEESNIWTISVYSAQAPVGAESPVSAPAAVSVPAPDSAPVPAVQ
jgi:hypothetical protein